MDKAIKYNSINEFILEDMCSRIVCFFLLVRQNI